PPCPIGIVDTPRPVVSPSGEGLRMGTPPWGRPTVQTRTTTRIGAERRITFHRELRRRGISRPHPRRTSVRVPARTGLNVFDSYPRVSRESTRAQVPCL